MITVGGPTHLKLLESQPIMENLGITKYDTIESNVDGSVTLTGTEGFITAVELTISRNGDVVAPQHINMDFSKGRMMSYIGTITAKSMHVTF
jgi:hypothetical protein